MIQFCRCGAAILRQFIIDAKSVGSHFRSNLDMPQHDNKQSKTELAVPSSIDSFSPAYNSNRLPQRIKKLSSFIMFQIRHREEKKQQKRPKEEEEADSDSLICL
jgi:hypothetical protein